MEAKEQDLRSEFTIEVNKAVKGIVAIAEQDSEKRGLIVIAVDTANDKKVEVIGTVGGNPELLIKTLSKILQTEKRLKRIMEKAMMTAKIENILDELLSELSDCNNDECADCDKKAECDLINKNENEN
jgi:hypothetical protein